MKLNVRKEGKPSKPRKVTTCPECGSRAIEWKLSLDTLRHDYVCPDCGYQGTVLLETSSP
ncbi:MAG: hypothetical protein GWN18_14955 [Thermoplasmata archaeon]|nr:hypothetical protein [Thermoplasmata archaeon]NIS13360.1 hypothetical protein [Thermoplasmata archaeon]NIS21250.1 hypothetical protein [Thermoplasmata archaeon]NIT78749.1 hypothetical protein [Thermoplasmata archaeon]NIU50303.1 hypothetical protein [Thermoplasmata archaeon]